MTPGSASPTDYEQYGYDVAGNVVLERRRGGAVFGYGYDALNQAIGRDAPGTEPDTVLAYDNFGRVRSLSRAGQVLSYGYDGLGRLVSEAGPSGGIGYGYDAADRRIRLSWPDGQALSYSYDQTGAMTRVDGPSGALIAQFSYDDLGRRGSLSRANGAVSVYGYDGASRLISLRQDFPAAADMVTQLAYNPASQAVLQDVTPSSYAFAQGAGPRQSYASNGLNQYAQAAGEAASYNANGAQVSRGARSYGYDAADRLIAANAGGGASLAYDPAGRLSGLVVGGQETRFLYDGAQLAAEANAGGTIIRRYVPGPGVDETLALIDADGVSHAMNDQRNTPSAWADAAGNPNVQLYGAFGEEGPANTGRIGFTGQMRLPELGLAYYKARFYDPAIGRFLTPDPAGFTDSPNLYAYVLNDPVNLTDPSGLNCVVITGSRIPRCSTELTASSNDGLNVSGGAGSVGGGGGGGRGDPCAGAPADEICVPGRIIPRMPFDPGPAVFISLSDPIFGRGPPGRMGLPPEIDPEPGREEMMETMGAMRNENCKNAFTTAGTVAGALVGLAVTGAALAAAPAGVVIAVGVGGFFAGAAIGGAFGYSAGGPAGAAGAAYVSGLAVPFGRVGFAAAFPGRAATALVAGIRGTSPAGIVSFATSLVGTAAGSSLGAALCNR